MAAVSIRIEGRVQGVGFRAFVLQEADRLGIGGEVWNTRDDAVELLGSHADPGKLALLVERLKTGPGHVTDVRSEGRTGLVFEQGFRIGPTR